MEASGPVTSAPEYRVSGRIVAAVRLHPLRAYVIAHRCGLNPSTLSKLVNGIDWVALGDERVLRLAAFLGIPAAEAFDHAPDSDKQEPRSPAPQRTDPDSLEDGDGP
jgi:hypothetical protein